MTTWRDQVRLTPLAAELERAHAHGVGAALAGMQDAGLGPVRLTGTAVPVLAEAAVTSATPFLRAPLLSRLHRVRRLHTTTDGQACPTCQVPSPCPTAQELDA
ncbi:hypothetical protein [Cellulomonas aerilata]|uniref:Uncharacterized protein n=1 Tax=Cellulomonas aerilata TaxID=515326 RepID=A0A512DHC0_9CELL|nr:hypothetical protein [Cellulomonas aerilata]GEO35852.1 hypothetical protein CAE01nite_35770 [Cellulomonas aerilata]